MRNAATGELSRGEPGHARDSDRPRSERHAHTVSLRSLSKVFGPVIAVEDLSLDVEPGEFLTLLGPSGSGKTTVLMMIAGFVKPSRGEILLDTRPITHLLPEQRDFGVVFQGYALFPHMTVAENVSYPLRIRRLTRSDIKRRVEDVLQLVELTAFRNRLPRQLSGGQQQRVALARALAFDPNIMLLDEPLSALDKKLRSALQLELRELHQRIGATFINVTHDQEEALTMSDRIVIMRDGRAIQSGSPEELYERPRTRFVADFLGRSNFLSARVTGQVTDYLELDIGGVTVRQRRTGSRAWQLGDAVLLALRPNKIALGEIAAAGGPANRVQGRVKSVVYVGAYALITVETPFGDDLIVSQAISPMVERPAMGETLPVSWEAGSAVIVEDD